MSLTSTHRQIVTAQRLVAALLLTLPLVGCGGGETVEPAADPAAAAPPAAEAPSASDAAVDADTCSALTAAELAGILGAEEGNVAKEEFPVEDLPEGLSQCTYTAKHAGLETTVTLYSREAQNDGMAAMLPQDMANYLANGEKVGGRTYVYEAANLGGVDGALSAAQGSKYIWIRMFIWHSDVVFYRLTVASAVDEVAEAPVPSPELFDQLIAASTN
ncbi:MAG: hypothetical protein AAGM22_10760 [Acidobacteriota bacterium]